MLAQLTFSQTLPAATHLLVLLPKAKTLPKDLPHGDLLAAVLKRRNMKADELVKSPVVANAENGTLVAWAMLDFEKDMFAQQVQVRKALQLLLDEHPKKLCVVVLGDEKQRQCAAELAVYGAWVNGAVLPAHKKKDERKPLQQIVLVGSVDKKPFDTLRAQASGNLLCRELTALPPNELTPDMYRKRVQKLAQQNRWQHEEFDMQKLRKMGAGAFVAVAQGSDPGDAAIVHLSYKHPKAKQTVALVGKGICFDTGGHNLKPSRYMHNMHEDMNGSAVALGILLAATHSQLPVNIDCWLALAQNHISPKAYKQNDIITALNGTSIEIIHTDAEGRMVLADTLTLASRGKPDWMIDFATLTGSMATALGARYSGVLGNHDELLLRAVRIGKQCGERLCAFPLDEDYEAALDSKVADIKQCTLDGAADHILATRFLKRFVEHDVPWLHVDLSASRCEGGLGSVAGDITGFGVGWGLQMLQTE
ncbi:MAG TPA: leucyl aminopeptidase family protein [Gallionella sp.]|jgi:leucyl aminopeptidase|nr:leucyl aminopeptidase family protein [Gallionella sp.]